MVDVTIHQCTLRVVRHGGWSWGPDPKGLAREAVSALGALLARHLAEAWAEGAEGELTMPLQIIVRFRAGEFARVLEEPFDDVRASAFHQRLREAVTAAVLAPPLAR